MAFQTRTSVKEYLVRPACFLRNNALLFLPSLSLISTVQENPNEVKFNKKLQK